MGVNDNFDSLILLIGTNPLPNFVTAEYFIKNNNNLKDIILLYSEETDEQKSTREYAENIQNLIKTKHPSKDITFLTESLSDISDAKSIVNDMKRFISKLSPDKKVHLNYTGGTKAMVIHVYRAIENALSDQKILKASFSYLDARKFRLVYDKEGIFTSDMREEIKMSLQDVLDLHGFERKNSDSEIFFSDSIRVFKELIEKEELNKYFEAYRRDYFLAKNSSKLVKRKSQIKDELRNMKAQEPLLSVILALPEEYRIFKEDGSFREPASRKQLEKTVEFIDGRWLEQYIYQILKEEEVFKDCDININWEIGKPEWGFKQKFELDLCIVKGYQLIGLSCTTSDERRICKSKGFEILHRTRQIGGEEAKAVLVTRLKRDQRDELEVELAIDTGGKENILVLGEEDLRKDVFIDRLVNFIN